MNDGSSPFDELRSTGNLCNMFAGHDNRMMKGRI